MIVLGIDPGLATTGWAVLDTGSGKDVPLQYGCFLTPAGQPLSERLETLAVALEKLIDQWSPQVAAVEELYFAKNSQTAASVGHARGVILFVLRRRGLPINEYNPRQVKMAVTGFGAAEKGQMQRMVQRLLGLKEMPKPDDAADALAIALCHSQSAPLKTRTKAAL